jgi:hypothetical protein
MKQVAPDVQEGFDKIFPDHKGHMLEKVEIMTGLSCPFVCSCGKILRVTIQMQILRPGCDAFFNYFRGLLEERTTEFNALSEAAGKLGYALVSFDYLMKMYKKLNLKEGESI